MPSAFWSHENTTIYSGFFLERHLETPYFLILSNASAPFVTDVLPTCKEDAKKGFQG